MTKDWHQHSEMRKGNGQQRPKKKDAAGSTVLNAERYHPHESQNWRTGRKLPFIKTNISPLRV